MDEFNLNLKMALEMVKGEALHTHNSHDGLGRGLCIYIYMFQTN